MQVRRLSVFQWIVVSELLALGEGERESALAQREMKKKQP